MTIALALLLGGLLGAAGAILLEFLNPRVRTGGGIERMLGVPVVGRIALPRQGPAVLPDRRGPQLLEARAA
jgi:capsular polysaccharide biosynthesis protein